MQHEHHRVPVTALAFWDENVILVGEGALLKAYDTDRKTLLAAVEVFDSQAIHGIVVADGDESWLVAWGGSDLCYVKLARSVDRSIMLKVGRRLDANDWILDIACSTPTRDGQPLAVLVTAHNALQLLPAIGLEEGQVEPLVAGSNCILYCAHIRWLSSSQCLIASGTAFGDVIVWSCSLNDIRGELSVEHQTHYTYSAHEGSVFGVQISTSAVAQQLAGRQRLLATCSDDRTIRLWDVSNFNTTSPTLIEQQRQTGFGSTAHDNACAPPALSKVMGHISRIWHVRLEQSTTTGEGLVLSFGEDATNITWAISVSTGQCELPYSLQQVNLKRSHNGKNLWSLAMKDHQLATGGADGAISLQHLSPFSGRQDASSAEHYSVNDDRDMGIFRAYGFIDKFQVLACTDHGTLHLIHLGSEEVAYSKVSDPITGLCGYSVMASIANFAFVAGADGEVWLYQRNGGKLTSIAKTRRKVAGLFVQQLSTDPPVLGLLITNMGKSTASLYHIDSDSHQPTSQLEPHELHIPHGFVTTSFACAHSNGRLLALLGSRNGSITIFDTTIRDVDNKIPHVLQYSRAHAAETVTKLLITSHPVCSDEVYLISSGRDGTCAMHHLIFAGHEPRMRTAHQLSLPFGPNIEGLGLNRHGHLLVWGFRSTQFVVFDIQTQQEVMTVECGGAHRIWSFQPDQNGGTFVWTKASRLYRQTQSQLPREMINAGGHGREIKCTAISPVEPRLIATGAEDTDIKLSVYQNDSFKTLHTLQKHNTGIQHLQWSNNGEYLFSSGGFEELCVWRITKDIPHIDIGVICESRHPRSGSSDLRIMNFDVQDGNNNDTSFHIVAVYSDSSLRSWHYKPQDRTWILLGSGDYLTSCLTQCVQLDPASTHPEDTTTLLTASTDGHIAFWKNLKSQENGTGDLEWFHRQRIHQNAILALCSRNLSDQSLLLITAGDDNAIGITRVVDDRRGRGNGSRSYRTLLISRAHAAAVTALCTVRVEEGDGGKAVRLWLVSASIDQRVKLWKVDVDMGREGIDGVDVELVTNVFTSVADVSSMEVMPLGLAGAQKGVLVCGVGMDVWKFEEEKALK